MDLKEEKIESELKYDGKFLKLYYDKVKCPNGNISTREYIKHPGASAILAIIDNKIVLERQFRYAVNETIYEIPAGKRDEGENFITCAKRELEEEIGYISNDVTELGHIYTTCGFADEVIYLYLAKGLIKTQTHFDEDEFIEPELFTLDEIKEMIKTGKIVDAKTICAINLYELKKD